EHCPRVDVPGRQTRPARLVTGADARAIVAVEILVEQDQITPVRIGLEFFHRSINRPATFRIAQKDIAQAPRDLIGNLPQGELLTGTLRTLNFELVAIVRVESSQRLDQ